ncbi:MAG: hypothetical protein ACFFBD_09240 [Candidatus Hodarchaeota archaeon]
MKVERICKYCNKLFIFRYKPSSNNRGLYCSKKCFYSDHQVIKKCAFCNKDFVASKAKARAGRDIFCCKKCYLDYQRRNQKKHICEYCSKIYFVSKNTIDSHYCSKECKKNAKGVKRICKYCKKPFWANRKKLEMGFDLFCSKECAYNSKRVIRKCAFCGKEYKTKKSANKKFCSRECMLKGHDVWNKNKTGYIIKKRRNQQLQKGAARICKCLWCKKEFYNPKWRIELNMMCCCLEHARLYAKHKNTIEISCRGCGKRFRVKLRFEKGKPIRTTKTFCSETCRTKNYNAVDGYCAYCGKKIKMKRHLIGKNRHFFCSHECHYKAQDISVGLYPENDGKTIQQTTGFINQATEERRKCNDGFFRRIYKAQHRLVVEKILGRKLKFNSEPILHMNGLQHDNRPENLYVCSTRTEMQLILTGISPYPAKSNINNLIKEDMLMASLK